jgi:hypothetical protein
LFDVKVEVGFHSEEGAGKPASIEDKKGALKMRFMMIVQAKENSGPPPQQLMDAIGKIADEATKAGQMIESGGLARPAVGRKYYRHRRAIHRSEGSLRQLRGI